MKVLVVDDDRSWRDIVSSVLQRAGWEVVEAESGEKALEIFSGAGPGEFKVIVTDYDMGEGRLNGAGLIARARELRGADVSYIMLTGGDIDTAWADIFLTKRDFSGDVLLAAVGSPA